MRAVFDALTDPTGVASQRPAALERAAFVVEDWHDCRRRLDDVEARMTGILDELDLTEVVTSIPGLSTSGNNHGTSRISAIAAALLRQLHIVVTRRVRWDAALAAPPTTEAVAA